MTTTLEKERKVIEDTWYDEEMPIGGFGIFAFSALLAFLLGYTYEWSNFTFFEGTQHVVLLIGFAIYVGRQMMDYPWLYLVLSHKERYQTLAEQQQIAYERTEHVTRGVYLVFLTTILYFFNGNVHLLWSIPILLSFFVLPLGYRIVANRSEKNVEEKRKKKPTKRISADGKVDLSHLPFVFVDIETYDLQDQDVKQAAQGVQQLLDEVTLHVATIDDIEIVHTLKRMGEEELPRLLQNYQELDRSLQQEYAKKTLTYLHLLEKKLKTYKMMINEQKTKSIQATFSLLAERYQNEKGH